MSCCKHDRSLGLALQSTARFVVVCWVDGGFSSDRHVVLSVPWPYPWVIVCWLEGVLGVGVVLFSDVLDPLLVMLCYLIAIWSLSDHFREPLGLAHPGVVGCNRHWPLHRERLPLFKVRIPVLRLGIHVDGFHAFAISMQYDLLRSHKTMLEIKNVNHVWKMHM